MVSIPSLSGHAIAYRWRSLPRVHRHRASSQGSSSKGCCVFRSHRMGSIFVDPCIQEAAVFKSGAFLYNHDVIPELKSCISQTLILIVLSFTNLLATFNPFSSCFFLFLLFLLVSFFLFLLFPPVFSFFFLPFFTAVGLRTDEAPKRR